MSFESEALAPDEFSLLDLFGSDASPRAQAIVQTAADSSMNEMAEVINAAIVAEPKHPAEPNTSSVVIDILTEHTNDLRREIDRRADLVNQAQAKKYTPLYWPDLHETKVGKTVYYLMDGNIFDEFPVHVTKHFCKEIQKVAACREVDAKNNQAKQSLIIQLAHQLTIAMAEGADLTKLSLSLNMVNQATNRIEPINIYATGSTLHDKIGPIKKLKWPLNQYRLAASKQK